jgi:hypothetical protein
VVTVTATPTGAAGATLRVLVLTGAVESGGASDGPAGNTGGHVSLTPNFSNSFIAWSNNNAGSSGAFTSLANNTILDNIATTGGERMATGYYSGTVTSGTAVTAGATGASTPTTTSVYEVPPSGGSTPVIDASSPAVVDETSGSAALTTASFSPPAAVLVAIVTGANFPSAWTVSSSPSLTWTKRIDNGDGQQIWTATYTAATTTVAAVPAAPGRTWSRMFQHRQQVTAPSPPHPITGAAPVAAAAVAAGQTTKPVAGAAAAVAASAAAGQSTKPASASCPAVAAGTAAGTTAKPVTAAQPAVASTSASASVTASGINVSGAAAVAAAGAAAGASTKPVAAAQPAVAAGHAAGASTKPAAGSRPAVASLAASASLVVPKTAGASQPAVAAIAASASVSLPGPVLVQQVAGTSTSDYGASSVQITTTGGNGVVVYAGWDVHNGVTDAPIPVVYVADSAANIWYHLGTSGAGGYGSRSAVWWCPNARAMDWVSVATTAFTSSLAYLVCEFSGLPDWSVADVEADAFAVAGGASEQVFTKAGGGTWHAPAGVTTVSAQCWGGGGGGSGGAGNAVPIQGGAGGAGGEYAAEASLAVTAGNAYGYAVGGAGAGGAGGTASKPGSGGTGGQTSFPGDSATVAAHGGHGGPIPPTSSAAGGTGSTNSVHHNGGAGGAESSAQHGIGGGSSAGPSSAGTSVATDVKAGAPGVTFGGAGGNGGNSTSPLAGNAPPDGPGGGGGGGGASSTSGGAGANGFAGQILLSWTVSSPVTLALSATTATVDIAFAVFAAGSGTGSLSSGPSSPWNALDTVSAGGSNPDGMTIFPYWASAAASTALAPSWTVTPSASLSAVMATVEASPTAPTQASATIPNLSIQMAFGATPGDPTAAPPTWTDITALCVSKDGDPYVSPYYGREYELSTPEAGTMVIGVDNHLGYFTPTNQASPYWPDIVVTTPVRVQALWDGAWYPVAYGYVERWPQEWPDLPQWGLSKLTITDSIAVLASANIPSALIGQVIAGGPYALFPCTEQYLTYINGLTAVSGNLASYSISEASGLIAANASRVNQTPGVYCDGTLAQMETGAALNLYGDQGTGCGTSAISGNVTYGSAATTGPGMIYTDPAMPDPETTTGMSIELWFVYDFSPEVSGQGCTIFQAFSGASSYWPVTFSTPGSPAGFAAYLNSTSNTISLILNGTTISAGSFTPSASPQHLVITWPGSAGSTLNVYLNGALIHSATLSAGEITAWDAIALGPCTYAYAAAPFVQDYVAGRLALYAYTMPAAQVAANYAVGAAGASGVSISQRAAQILDWAYLGLPHGGPVSFGSPAVGDGITYSAAYSLDGSSASDALAAVTIGDGMIVAMPTGILTVLPKWALFNLAATWTLGDATNGTEIPYLPGQAYDYDNTYLYDDVAVTRQNGPNTSITAEVKDIAAQSQYFPRGALDQTIITTSDLDAYTLANWELAAYGQPSLRVRGLTISAEANPTQAFPAVLEIKAGDVVTVNRRPVGGAVISGLFIVQKVTMRIGAGMWRVSYQMSPYQLPSAVLTLDEAGYNALGSNTLG